MPWCPKCRMEYNPGIALCSDCQELLVDNLSQSKPNYMSHFSEETNVIDEDTIHIIPLVELEDMVQAAVFQNILEESEIKSIINRGYLCVSRDDYENAKFIITEYMNSLDTGEMPETGDDEPEP